MEPGYSKSIKLSLRRTLVLQNMLQHSGCNNVCFLCHSEDNSQALCMALSVSISLDVNEIATALPAHNAMRKPRNDNQLFAVIAKTTVEVLCVGLSVAISLNVDEIATALPEHNAMRKPCNDNQLFLS